MKTITFISQKHQEITTCTAVTKDLAAVFKPLLEELHKRTRESSMPDHFRAIRNLEKHLLTESTIIVITDVPTNKTEVIKKQPNGDWEPQIIRGSGAYAKSFFTGHWELALNNYLDTLK